MTTNLPPYPAYKPSGIPWLGDVPVHWEVRRTKTVLLERSEKGFPHEPLLAATQTKGVVRKEQYESRTVLALKDLHLLKLVKVGDFVISLRSFQGGIEYAREQGIISPAYTILYLRNPDVHGYLAWLFKSQPYIQNLTLHVTGIRQGQNIDYLELSRSYLPLPPLPEQASIVRYLDHVDRRIRRYVAAKRKLTALLEEEKQAVVNRAVTRGLDPNIRLKPSGVEWLGDVPEHWDVIKLRRCVSISGGMTPSMDVHRFWDGPVPWVTPKDMKQAVISDSSVKVTETAIHETSLQFIEPPAILMVVRGMILARRVPIASTTAPVTINQDMKALKPMRGTNPAFLARSLDSAQVAFVPLIDEAGHGTRRLPMHRWRELPVAIPPLFEQATIVRHIDKATADIDAAIARARHQIELVQEYRTRLIADVVTGKLDVREAAAHLPEEDDEDIPIDGDGLILDNVGDNHYDAMYPEDELEIKSEVGA